MAVHADFFHEGLDTFIDYNDDIYEIYKPHFLDVSFNNVFDLIVFLARHPKCPIRFVGGVVATFMQHPLAYVFEYKSRTIFPSNDA